MSLAGYFKVVRVNQQPILVPNLFKKECRKRQEFCETHGIEFKLPRFKSKQGKT